MDEVLQGLKDQLVLRESHAYCKKILSGKRKLYKCPQRRIAVLKNVNHWEVYIEPEGLEGNFSGCCKYEAMIKALDSKFGGNNTG